MTEQSQKNANDFHVSLLGCGLLFGALAITLCPTNLSWVTVEQTELSWFNSGFAAGLFILGFIGCLYCLGFPQACTRTVKTHRTIILIVATICFVASQLYIGYCSQFSTNSPWLMGANGVLASMGILGLGMLWFLVFRTDSTDHILITTAISLLVVGVVAFIFFFIQSLPLRTLCASVLAAISSLFLYRAQKAANKCEPSESTQPNTSPTSSAMSSKPALLTFGRAYSNLWLPLVGAMISCFILGLVWNPVLSETSRTSNAFSEFGNTIAGAALVLGAVIITIKAKPGLGALPRFVQISCPVAMAILLVHPFLDLPEGLPEDIGSTICQAGFYATAVFVWASAVASSDDGSMPPLAFYFPCLSLLALAYGAGFLLIHVLGIGGKDVCVILLTVFLVLYSFSLMQANQTEKHGRIVDEIRPDQFIHKRCDELAKEFGISPRETEVLYYLGRGYNHGYIARKLFLSENTVRTHVRHIYAKLGISSREELLNIIDENDVEDANPKTVD